jgi:hypothetical protein
MLLLWFALQLAAMLTPALQHIPIAYTWGWAIPFVALAFLFLIRFCLDVVRQRTQRLTALGCIFLLFLIGAWKSAAGGYYEQKLTALLWERPSMRLDDQRMTADEMEPVQVAEEGSAMSLEPSDDEQEERWRSSLRAVMEKEKRDEERYKTATGTKLEEETATGATLERPSLLAKLVEWLRSPSDTGTGTKMSEAMTGNQLAMEKMEDKVYDAVEQERSSRMEEEDIGKLRAMSEREKLRQQRMREQRELEEKSKEDAIKEEAPRCRS